MSIISSHYQPGLDGDPYEAENSFYLLSHPGRVAKLLAHYELYKMVSHLPGAIIEAGVYKGASLMRFATFRETLETSHSRPIVGFDAFGSFPKEAVEGASDQAFIDRFEGAGGPGISKEQLAQLIAAKGFDNVQLIEGDIFHTLPRYLEDHPETRIALLHLDLDVYEPTAFVLDQLVPCMVPGGLIVIDDYDDVEGATRAVDAVCRQSEMPLAKLPHYRVPAFIKMT